MVPSLTFFTQALMVDSSILYAFAASLLELASAFATTSFFTCICISGVYWALIIFHLQTVADNPGTLWPLPFRLKKIFFSIFNMIPTSLEILELDSNISSKIGTELKHLLKIFNMILTSLEKLELDSNISWKIYTSPHVPAWCGF